MQGFKSKKGAAIVESVMVFPLVILSVIVLIFMMVYFYAQLNERVDMHIALRAESGRICQNVFYNNKESNNFSIYKKVQQIYSHSAVKVKGNMISERHEKEITARKYLIDECKFVRMSDVVEDE